MQNGPAHEPQKIPLHIDIRYRSIFTNDTVVINTLNRCDGSGWGTEEDHGGFPFSRGSLLDISILLQNNCFLVNSLIFFDFLLKKFKVPYQFNKKIKCLILRYL